jgi:multidrug efflux pump subunit AcrA (membrane-fusion protein)
MDASPDDKLAAAVTYVSPQVDVQKGTCLVRAEIREQRPYLRHGMTGSIQIAAGRFNRVLAVPSQFIEKTPRGAFVWFWEDGAARRVRADFRQVGERWAILNNIAERDVLLLPDSRRKPSQVAPGKEVPSDAR